MDRIFSFAGDAIDSVTQWVSVTAERATNYLADVAKSIQQMADALSKAEEILNTLFNVHARQAIDMFLEQPIGFVNNVLSALGQGLQRYVDHLGANLKEGLISWLAQKAGITLPANLDLSKPEQAIGVVLNMMGLSPRELVLAAIQQSGSKNAAILAQAYHYVEKFLVDPANSTASVLDAIKHLANLEEFAEYTDSIQNVLKELDTKKLFEMAIDALKKAVLDSLTTAITKTVLKQINPSIGAITTMIDIGRWFVNNIDLIGDFVTEMGKAVPHLKNNVPEAALAVERGLKKATPMVISLVASLANLNELPIEARKAMQGLGAKVRETLVTALSKALIVAEKVVKSRWPKKSNGDAQTSGYAGQASHITRWSVPTGAKAETHTLHATTGSDIGASGTSGPSSNTNNNAPATGTVIYRGAKEVTLDKQLHEWNEQTKDSELKKKILAASSHLKEKLQPLVTAIAKAFKHFNQKLADLKKVRDNTKSTPQQVTTAEGESAAALASLTKAQDTAEPALQQQATLVQACEADAAGCFAAGTKLWTPHGYQNVEDLREGDLVYSRNEYAPSGVVEAKPIEKAFRRLAEVQHLHLRGPNGNLVTIRTTGEHPFYAFGKGWMPTKELTSEDWVLTDNGDWAKVEEVFATGEMEVVYNLRVADWHTYFVGDEGWGWTAWAHNAYYLIQHLRRGVNSGPSLFNSGDWHVYEGCTVRANADRVIRFADASSPYSYKTREEAITACMKQNAAERKAESGTDDGTRFEQRARRRIPGITRVAEHIVKLDGTVASEIDFQTSSTLYECGTSFAAKTEQLMRLCIVARLRGMTVIGIYREDNPDRFNAYQEMLNSTTFWNPQVQNLLRELTPNFAAYSDDTPLANYFSRFEHLA